MKKLFFAALVFFLAVLAWVLWRQARPVGDAAPPPTASAGDSAASGPAVQPPADSSAPRAEVLAQAAAPPPLPAEMTMAPTLSGVYAELLQLAQGGDVRAMDELGRRLMRCGEASLARERQRVSRLEQLPAPAGDNADASAEKRRQEIERARGVIAECEGLPADQRGSGEAWLQRAADLGYGEAQLSYVELALDDYRSYSNERVGAEIDEVLRRRELARRYMGEAVTHCVPGALQQQARSMRLLFDGGDARALAIAEAAAFDASLREAQAAGSSAQASHEADFARASAGLDAAGLAEARRQGEAMYQTCAPLPR